MLSTGLKMNYPAASGRGNSGNIFYSPRAEGINPNELYKNRFLFVKTMISHGCKRLYFEFDIFFNFESFAF